MHHADDVALDVDGHAEHRTDAPLSEDRVYDVGVVEILDDDRTSLGGDAASETTGKRYLHALADLLLQSSCGACDEDPAILIEQQHRGGVDFQGAAYALQKLGKHVLQGHVAERGVGDAQQMAAATLETEELSAEFPLPAWWPLSAWRFELLGLHGPFIPVFGRMPVRRRVVRAGVS